MSKGFPNNENDIDDFFKNQLDKAEQESILHEISWEKIAHQLDMVPPVYSSAVENIGLNAANTATQGGTSLIASIMTLKGIVISSSILSIASISTYLMLASFDKKDTPQPNLKANLNLSVDTTSEVKSDTSIQKFEIFAKEDNKKDVRKGSNSSPLEDAIEIGPINKEGVIVKEENKMDLPNDNQNIEKTANEDLPLNETTKKEENAEVTKDEEPLAEPVKDFRTQQLEKAKKKSRLLFEPKKEKP